METPLKLAGAGTNSGAIPNELLNLLDFHSWVFLQQHGVALTQSSRMLIMESRQDWGVPREIYGAKSS